MGDRIDCSFFAAGMPLRVMPINIATGHGAKAVGLKLAACNSALALGYTHVAVPDVYAPDAGNWLVYALVNDIGRFRAKVPSQAAAEMWMIHHGPKL